MATAPDPSAPRTIRGPGEPTDTEKLELVAQLLDILPDFFYVHDEEMVFRYANMKAVKYFGCNTREELIGRRLHEVDPNKEQAKFFEDVCRKIMREGKPRHTDNLPYVRPDGTRGWLRQHDIPFVNPNTGRMMLMGCSRDVTSEKELEDQRLRAARLEEELSLARAIQKSLTPRPGEVMQGLDVAGFSEPAQFAGGDFYDWGMGERGEFLCGVGDATGHGVGPALLAASCRAYARVLLAVLPLPEAMARLNEQICEDASDGRFITFAAASVNPKSFVVHLVSAGHGPVYVLRRRGQVDELEVGLPPLGVLVGADACSAATTTLEPGDALVLVSDGVFEAHDPRGRLLGTARLRDVLTRAGGASASDIVARVRKAVEDHADGEPAKDDATILAVVRQ
jgi:PAS domain S-box-containing protein